MLFDYGQRVAHPTGVNGWQKGTRAGLLGR